MLSTALIAGLLVILVLYTKDIRDLEIKARKRKSEWVLMVICMAAILGMTPILAQVWVDYVVGVLGILTILLEFNRRGITSRGIIVGGELNIFGYWKRVQLVEITDNDRVKVVITRTALFRDEVHFYDPRQHERIVAFLLANLPEEKVKITEKTQDKLLSRSNLS